MADSLTNDLIKYSVTADDQGEYKGNGVVTFLIPWFMMGAANLPLPADLPPYWTLNLGIARYWSRDMVLRSTILHEDFWAGALAKATTKQAARSFEVKGRGSDRYQDMLLEWGGDGYVPSQERGLIDFLCTNNGSFWEIVRQSGAMGSRIIGLMHLDSLRCIRTGDPDIPVVFVDLRGKYHELRNYQVMQLVDQPDPSSASLGIGHCAAERAYHQIYKQSAIEQYYREKVTGTGASSLHFVSGLNAQQIEKLIEGARLAADAKGNTYFQGNIIAGLLAQVEPKLLTINLRNLPDGFDREKELEISQLAYALAIGMPPQDLNPRLSARGALGIGAQSQVLEEKSHGEGVAAYVKQLTHLINEMILPNYVTFSFNERDLREESTMAQVELIREQKRASMITNGQLTPAQALQMAIEADDAPREFMPPTATADVDQPLTDEEKPIDKTVQGLQAVQPPVASAPQPTQPAQLKEQTASDLLNSVDAQKELDALIALKDSIDAARQSWSAEQMKAAT